MKDRLGPKRVPIWNRLEKLPPLWIDSDTTGKRKRHVETEYEDKRKMTKTRRNRKGKDKEPQEEVVENEIEEE